MKVLISVSLLVCFLAVTSARSATCKRWCRTPKGQAYCCEGGNEPERPVFDKRGQCPPVRPSCPPVRFFAPPQTCSNDGSCDGNDKCCFDTCLEQHVCKPPRRSGGFGGPGAFGGIGGGFGGVGGGFGGVGGGFGCVGGGFGGVGGGFGGVGNGFGNVGGGFGNVGGGFGNVGGGLGNVGGEFGVVGGGFGGHSVHGGFVRSGVKKESKKEGKN